MNRRLARKNGPIPSGWSVTPITARPVFLASNPDAVPTETIDTLRLQTASPGMKALNVQTFIQKRMANCPEKAFGRFLRSL
ncbi:hypothetical protein [Larkinella rosea]|uniref:Uncharacterized protein n=1 Tax=Larkinella rosea TaxID=2025312 RepID=A0A3P1BUU8_9BACT|nr:hypothetical protein [Larkinella rosea]RRB04782.1 hypothetical protein EHT25_15055 [Larkinella rosea]